MEFRIRFIPTKPCQVKALEVVVESENEETAAADARYDLRLGINRWDAEYLPHQPAGGPEKKGSAP